MFIAFKNYCSICRKTRKYKKPLDESAMLNLTRKTFSSETMKKVQWVRNMYNDWCEFRNSQPNLQSVECDIEDISSLRKEIVVPVLCKFITEVRKIDGSEFPARTLYDIIICMQFWFESNGLNWRLISDGEFKDLKFTLDNLMKERASSGVGNAIKQAEVLTFTDEDLLWSQGLLGVHSPTALLNTVVFQLGLTCSLRAGKEHRSLRSIPFKSQFEFVHDSQYNMFLRYTEDFGLKTNKGGLKHRSVECKVVDVYPINNVDRCPVKIFQTYLAHLPSNRVCQALYLQPRKKFNCKSWYLDKPVGINTLQNVVKNLCETAGLPGYYTNHSLRSSSATRMYRSGIDEQIISEITGHRSIAVRSYKRTSQSQKQKASKIISGEIRM